VPARVLTPQEEPELCEGAACRLTLGNGSHAHGQDTQSDGLRVWGRRLRLVDSITEAVGTDPGAIVVSGSHGGLSAARFALEARPFVAVFNDAGIGKDGAGIAALAWLARHGIAAVAVAHHSACIGEALSTWNDGVISTVNAVAAGLGARAGMRLRAWLQPALPDGSVNGS
jgi:hypothetical protein